jgi:ATP-dependent DNA helicase Rep
VRHPRETSLTLSYCSRRETVACDRSRFIEELGDDVRMPDKPTTADAKASGSDQLAALKAMLG